MSVSNFSLLQAKRNFLVFLPPIVTAELNDRCLPNHQQLFLNSLCKLWCLSLWQIWIKVEEKKRRNLRLCLHGEGLIHHYSLEARPASSWASFSSLPPSVTQKGKVATPGARINTTTWTSLVQYCGLERNLWQNGQEEQPEGYVMILSLRLVCKLCLLYLLLCRYEEKCQTLTVTLTYFLRWRKTSFARAPSLCLDCKRP